MGEIKSTLDLVLEKTKHLRPDEGELRRLRLEEAKSKARGLTRKYLDGQVPFHRFREELSGLGDAGIREGVDRVLETVGPDSMPPDLLDDLLSWTNAAEEIHEIRRLFDQYGEDRIAAKEHFGGRILRSLQAERISGTAVIPNVDADPEYELRLEELHQRLSDRLRASKEALRKSLLLARS